MKSFFIRYFPIITITVFVVLISVLNYAPGKFLTGGDNLHPEFYHLMNIKRSIFSVWQEYQGLGLLGGMGHAADLPRQLFLMPVSIFLSVDQIRWFWTYLTLFIGTLGSYYLLYNLFKKLLKEKEINIRIIALIGALFYLLNLSTVQSYFTPFEVFTAHFAFLPWLLLVTINLFTFPTKKNWLILGIVMLISSPAAYVPTLFLVYFIASFILGIFIIPGYKNFLKLILKYIGLVFLINSYWLLPFLFFTITSVTTNVNAKINQMATDSIYMHNREFGNIWDVALLRGFWFNNVEPSLEGEYKYMLLAWKDHISNPFMLILGFSIFIIILIGIYAVVKKKNRIGLGMLALFIFCIMMLTTATPPFSFINDFIRNYFPLFGQIFRFPFTKFSILASLVYAFFFAYAIYYLLSIREKVNFKIYLSALIVSVFALVVFTFPIFTGNLFYQREKIAIPDEYFQTFEFFKDQNPNTRIANFPQHTYWGWNFYNWGYSGSGFIWYGINQPILDRTFDVWGKNNENYYWELNHALYSKNIPLFEKVLNKYDVDWILIDKNIINPSSPKNLFINDLKILIKDIPSIEKVKDFGNIEIYKYESKNTNNFVSTLDSAITVNSYNWSNYDQAYSADGNYYSKDGSQNTKYYPYREIFTGRSQKDIEFKVKESEKFVEFEAPIPEYNEAVKLNIPSLITQNSSLPIYVYAKRVGNIIRINSVLQTSKINIRNNLEDKTLWESKINNNLFETPYSESKQILNINGVSGYIIPQLEDGEENLIGVTNLTLEENNIFVLSNPQKNQISTVKISGENVKKLFAQNESYINLPKIEKDSLLIINIPKITDKYSSYIIDPVEKINNKEAEIVNCDNFRKNYFSYFIKEEEKKKLLELSSVNATPCVSFYLPTLDHNQAYLLRIDNKNIKERGLHFWVLNEDQKTAVIDTYFEKNKKGTTSTIVIPPIEKFGKSYSIHFDNASIGNIKAGNILGKIYINPIPFYFITNINIEKQNSQNETYTNPKLVVNHPNQSLYMVEANNPTGDYTLTLSQSFSPYWKAYKTSGFGLFQRSFPFLFGSGINNHLKINNWKNGWIVEAKESSTDTDNDKIIIVYLPQYLQYIGFALTSGTLIALIFVYLKDKKKKRHND